jgi:hypothetical protein
MMQPIALCHGSCPSGSAIAGARLYRQGILADYYQTGDSRDLWREYCCVTRGLIRGLSSTV